MPNLLSGFKLFVEKGDFVSTIKKQVQVPKKLWFGMPIVLSNVKLGDHLIRQPTAFYVTAFDSHTVTLKPVPYSALNKDGNGDDIDDEIDLDKADKITKKVTMTRDNFLSLLEPQNYQGADFTTASGGVQWKSSANTLSGPSGGGGMPPMGGM